MSFTGDITAWLPLIEGGDHSRQTDKEIAEALGWRVSHDEWWNWHPGPRFDPPGDAWCIRKDGRLDKPCNEALPHFTPAMLRELRAHLDDICAACGEARREHMPGGARWGENSLCGVFIPQDRPDTTGNRAGPVA